jgi:pyruvate/2-oxoglutarate dehydrogenase complex dihydrolipoamide dehydrogenase (E3) component
MSESLDVIVIGTGPAVEAAVGRLQASGQRVAVVEAD